MRLLNAWKYVRTSSRASRRRESHAPFDSQKRFISRTVSGSDVDGTNHLLSSQKPGTGRNSNLNRENPDSVLSNPRVKDISYVPDSFVNGVSNSQTPYAGKAYVERNRPTSGSGGITVAVAAAVAVSVVDGGVQWRWDSLNRKRLVAEVAAELFARHRCAGSSKLRCEIPARRDCADPL